MSYLLRKVFLLVILLGVNSAHAAWVLACQYDTDADGKGAGAVTNVPGGNSCPYSGQIAVSQCFYFGTGSACTPTIPQADNCPTIANADQLNTDGDSLGNACDTDDDNDGILDDVDPDDDNDGAQDGSDNCPGILNADQLNTDGDAQGNACDGDDDNDGSADTLDKFPLNAAASADTDNDGFPDSWNGACDTTCQTGSGLALDNCPSTASADQQDTDSDGQGNVCDSDDDNDGIADAGDAFPLDNAQAGDIDTDGIDGFVDNCPANSNADQLDTDGDTQGNVCDTDDDNDGVADASDKFPLNPAASSDSDNDSYPDSWLAACDATCQANSGLTLDNCPYNVNADQLNFDGDTQGDACDSDDDNDGLADTGDAFPLDPAQAGDIDADSVDGFVDNCPTTANLDQLNTDGDAQGNACDNDDDNDGEADALDDFPLNPAAKWDSDDDGFPSSWNAACDATCQASSGLLLDNCWLIANPDQIDTDNDTQGNVCDLDDDNDGVLDVIDVFPLDLNESSDTDVDGIGNQADTDDDNDGLADVDDNCSLAYNPAQEDRNGDGEGDVCDLWMSTALAAGGFHTCVLTASGGAKCWGQNDNKQLGDNTATGGSNPVNVVVVGSDVAAIDAGVFHTCALTRTGRVMCWGRNAQGQLGNNMSSAGVFGLDGGVSAISTAGDHVCALTASGAVKCWGYNFYGQLGDNSNTQRNAPVDVVGLGSNVQAIAAGGNHTCALTTAGGVKCWGNNTYGQLGDGTVQDRYVPVDVVGLGSGVAAIAAGSVQSCALTMAGGVKCWGIGRLGDGTVEQKVTPVDVVGLGSGVRAISVGAGQICALTLSGGVKCWGSNSNGKVGDGTTAEKLTPVDVVGLTSSVVAIAAGWNHSCALMSAGEVKCWGYNSNSQLGDSTYTNRSSPVLALGGPFIADVDMDGIFSMDDNCLSIANTDQQDADLDGQGNSCDSDDDNDGIVDASDAFPLDATESADTDSDGVGNNADLDDDNDSVPDYIDAEPLNAANAAETVLPLNNSYKGSQLKDQMHVQ